MQAILLILTTLCGELILNSYKLKITLIVFLFISLIVIIFPDFIKKSFYFFNLVFKKNNNVSVIVGNIRVQLLSETLCRIELKGAKGFEDRKTFTVVGRAWPGTSFKVEKQTNGTVIAASSYVVRIAGRGESLEGLRIEKKNGELLYEYSGMIPPAQSLPNPGDKGRIWLMSDAPRIVPPEWGAIPPPQEFINDMNSGWDIDNDAPDIYVFIPHQDDKDGLRRNFLQLTGRVPLPPIFAFGLWNSRYYAYSEESALSAIQSYRNKKIPLDVFVLDTDWRKGGSKGYTINQQLFPDMSGFLDRVHSERVFAVLNDHPESFSDKALDPKELKFRYENLTSLLSKGVDAWWYDRNWHAHLKEPAAGLPEEVWGMRLYHDITQKYRPQNRPLILSNVDGITHGVFQRPSHPAAHRYPIWWTGDTYPTWDFLQRGIANCVNSGILCVLPYVSEDLGGHFGQPTDEYYIRSLQYGAFSPIMRLHSSGASRYPWDYNAETEQIAVDYIKLRYRLLPLLYSAARQAYEDGTPMLRRCDIYWPEFVEAKNDQQYLLGDDLLIAPVNDVKGFHPIPDILLHLDDGKQGLAGEYFDNMKLQSNPSLIRIDQNINFDWGEGPGSSPAIGLPEDHFSIRWQTNLGPVPMSGQYAFSLAADDGARLWVDDQLIIDSWKDQVAQLHTGNIYLDKDKTYHLRLEYFDSAYKASCKLGWWNRDDHSIQSRSVWIPPGNWQDAWTGTVLNGPKTIMVSSELWHMPIYIRQGGVLMSIPQVQSTQDNLWSDIVIDAYMPKDDLTTSRILYEDDGLTTLYAHDAYRKTSVTLQREGGRASLIIGKSVGNYLNNPLQRTWTIRFHCPKNESAQKITLNGKTIFVSGKIMDIEGIYFHSFEPKKTENNPIFMGDGDEPAMNAGTILEIKAPNRNVRDRLRIEIELAQENSTSR